MWVLAKSVNIERTTLKQDLPESPESPYHLISRKPATQLVASQLSMQWFSTSTGLQLQLQPRSSVLDLMLCFVNIVCR